LVSCNTENKKEESTDTQEQSTVTVPAENTGEGEQAELLTSIQFAESVHDFGTINEGLKVEHVFRFKNTGENPLVLKDARASCGCTVPEYTKDPIAPGEEGELKVIYDSSNKEGEIEKSVTVIANTEPAATELKVRAKIRKKVDGPFTK
jgi:hypothetical protein